jgi:hypothetical protein
MAAQNKEISDKERVFKAKDYAKKQQELNKSKQARIANKTK